MDFEFINPRTWYVMQFVGDTEPQRVYVHEVSYLPTGELNFFTDGVGNIYNWANVIKIRKD